VEALPAVRQGRIRRRLRGVRPDRREVPRDSAFDVLFLGGSDGFKLGNEGWVATQRAKAAGKWVHMGRVNSLKRLLYAASIGCDSADGTFVGHGPSQNVPKVLSWLYATKRSVASAA
jgi:hypothetical protein